MMCEVERGSMICYASFSEIQDRGKIKFGSSVERSPFGGSPFVGIGDPIYLHLHKTVQPLYNVPYQPLPPC